MIVPHHPVSALQALRDSSVGRSPCSQRLFRWIFALAFCLNLSNGNVSAAPVPQEIADTEASSAPAADPVAILSGGILHSPSDNASTPAAKDTSAADLSQDLHRRLEHLAAELKNVQALVDKLRASPTTEPPTSEPPTLASVAETLTVKEGPITFFMSRISQALHTLETLAQQTGQAVLAQWEQRHSWLLWHDPAAHWHLVHALIQIAWIVTSIVALNLSLHFGLVRLWPVRSTAEQRSYRLHRLRMAIQMLLRDLIPPLLSFVYALVLFHFVTLEQHAKVVVMALLVTVAAVRMIPHAISIAISSLTAVHRPWLNLVGQSLARLGITIAVIHCVDDVVSTLLDLQQKIPFEHIYALLIAYTLINSILRCRHEAATAMIRMLRYRSNQINILQNLSGILMNWHWPAISLVVLGYMLFLLEEGYVRFLQPLTGLLVAALGVLALRHTAHFWNWVSQTMNRSEARSLFITTYHTALTRASQVVLFLVFGGVTSEFWGLQVREFVQNSPLLSAMVIKSFSIGTIVVVSLALVRAGTRFITRFMQRYDEAQHTHSPRIRSMAAILRHTLIWLISVPAFLLIMAELGFNTTPILASLSIGSLGLGLASQNIFKDVFAGLSIILENTMSVGDIVVLENQRGQVEEITMRYVRLRSDDGALHTFPLSSIEYITNCSRDFAYSVINLSFRHEDDLTTIYRVLRESLEHLRGTVPYDRFILEPLDIRGVDVMTDVSLQIQVRIKTIPGQQWFVRRGYLTKIKDSLLAAGLQPPTSVEHKVYLMPSPQVTVAPSTPPKT